MADAPGEQTDPAPAHVLVPVAMSGTLRGTIAYAVRTAQDAGPGSTVHFVSPVMGRAFQFGEEVGARARDLLDRTVVWAHEDLGFDPEADVEDLPIDIQTATVGADRYLFNPGDYAEVFIEYARDHGLDRVIVDPEYAPAGRAPMLQPLEFGLRQAGLDVEEAPVERPARRVALVRPGGAAQFGAVFAVAYLFYLVIGGIGGTFGLVTGAVSALVTAILSYRIVLKGPPSFRSWGRQLARFGLYVPYLIWEIAKANVELAYVILHPSLPIDPEMVHFEAAVWGDLPVTTLANSITLTPGTLTVDVSRREFHVHTLTGAARTNLLGGALEKGVRFIFYGRRGLRIASPAKRAEATADRQTAEGDGAADRAERPEDGKRQPGNDGVDQ